MSYNENQLAYLEVVEVLKKIPDDQRNCIPSSVIENLKSKCESKSFILKYDKSNSLIISQKAKHILVYLYQEYLTKDKSELRNMLNEKLIENENINEKLKLQNDNLKVKFDVQKNIEKDISQNTAIAEYKESIFKIIIQKFLKFFKR